MSTKPGLGKGLDALIPKEFDRGILHTNERIQKINVELIKANPDQPRKHFDEAALTELAESITAHGIVQPLVVIKSGSQYRVVAGERRLRAAKIAKLKEVPVIVRSMQQIEELEIAIIENVQRVDLSPLEQAVSIARLHDQFSLSYTDIAKKLGKAVPTIHNIVRLLQLPSAAKNALMQNQISEGHARAILALKEDNKTQAQLLGLTVSKGWSVRQAEQFVTAAKKGTVSEPKAVTKHMATSTPQTRSLSKRLHTDVKIRRTAKGGKLEIFFKDNDDLQRIAGELVS